MNNRIDKQSARYLKHCHDNRLFGAMAMDAIMVQWITDDWVIVTVDDTFTETIMLTETGRIVIGLVDDASDTEPDAEDDSVEPRYAVQRISDAWTAKTYAVTQHGANIVSFHDTEAEAQAEADRLNKTAEDDKPLSYRLVTETETEALRERIAQLEADVVGDSTQSVGTEMIHQVARKQHIELKELNTETEALRQRVAQLEGVIGNAYDKIDRARCALYDSGQSLPIVDSYAKNAMVLLEQVMKPDTD